MKALALLLAIVAVLAILRLQHPRAEAVPAPVYARRDTAPTVCVAYPHALVKCGVASSEEFEAQRTDPDLQEHYSEVGMVHPAVLTSDEWDFASFRGAGGIVWTPRRILVRAGEHVLRDRSGNTIRARCGNRLSQEPRMPTAVVMPPEMEHETPRIEFVEASPSIIWADKPVDLLMPPLPSLPSLSPLPWTPGEPPQDPMPAELLQPLMLGPPIVAGRLRIADTPEPSSFLLILGPMLALRLLWRRT